MSEFNFKSSICTSRSQSETLVSLGLKKETADMCYKVTTHDFKGNEINEKDRHYTLCCWYDESSLVCGLERKETIPAWSLHRLLNLSPESVEQEIPYFTKDGNVELVNRDGIVTKAWGGESLYDALIKFFQWLIKEGYFNQEYLI